MSRIFPFNTASRALCRAWGFREVGMYDKHGQSDGKWLDVVIAERTILETQTASPQMALDSLGVERPASKAIGQRHQYQ